MPQPKSTITITLTEAGQIELLVTHDPNPTGERKEWHPPAKLADYMVRRIIELFEASGAEPTTEATIHTVTGELDVITRKKEGE